MESRISRQKLEICLGHRRDVNWGPVTVRVSLKLLQFRQAGKLDAGTA